MWIIEPVLEQLQGVNFIPYVLSVLVGGAIGLEREIHGRPAGLRTHILVCLSSAVLIHSSRTLSLPTDDLSLVQKVVLDPNRLGTGIVTGIGFLGAAAVIRSGDIVRGITTGACVWAVASLGVVIGHGHYGVALTGAATMLTVLVVFDYLFLWVTPVIYRKFVVCGALEEITSARDTIGAQLREAGIKVQDISCKLDRREDLFEVVFHVRCRNRLQSAQVAVRACSVDGVQSAEWGQIHF